MRKNYSFGPVFLVLAGVCLNACSPFNGVATKPLVQGENGRLSPPLSISGNAVMYEGDTVEITNADSPGPVSIVVSNQAHPNNKKNLELTPEKGTLKIILDKGSLPWEPSDSETVQTFDFTARSAVSETKKSITVLPDKNINIMPEVPYQFGGEKPTGIGSKPWLPSFDVKETDNFIDQFVIKWNGNNISTSSSPIAKSQVSIPSTFEPLQEGVTLRSYSVKGNFPKTFIMSDFTSTGKSEVITPSELKVVVSETSPVRLISLRVI